MITDSDLQRVLLVGVLATNKRLGVSQSTWLATETRRLSSGRSGVTIDNFR